MCTGGTAQFEKKTFERRRGIDFESSPTLAFESLALTSRSSRSMVQSLVASTRTGSAPRRIIVDGSAVKVKPFVMTESPDLTPTPIIASRIADEQEFTPRANFCSNKISKVNQESAK